MRRASPRQGEGKAMRSPFPLLAATLLAVGLAACGSTARTNGPSRSGAAPQSNNRTSSSQETPGHPGSENGPAASSETPPTREEYATVDRDKDNDNAPIHGEDNDSAPYDDKNNDSVLNYGRAASPADRRAVRALIEHYYAAALKEDGATACSMLYVRLAESVAEDYGRGSPGPRYLSQGTSCPTVMKGLFKHYHGQLTAELPLLHIARVRLVQHHGLAILRFGAMPERQISVRQQAGAWKLATIFDSALP